MGDSASLDIFPKADDGLLIDICQQVFVMNGMFGDKISLEVLLELLVESSNDALVIILKSYYIFMVCHISGAKIQYFWEKCKKNCCLERFFWWRRGFLAGITARA